MNVFGLDLNPVVPQKPVMLRVDIELVTRVLGLKKELACPVWLAHVLDCISQVTRPSIIANIHTVRAVQ